MLNVIFDSSDDFKDVFLSHLGLAPLDDGPWPLKVSQRCLSILARVLLARQQKALQTNTGMDIAECVKEDVPIIQGLSQFIFISTIVTSVIPQVNIFIVFDLNGSDQSRELKKFLKNVLCSDFKTNNLCCNHFFEWVQWKYILQVRWFFLKK